MPWRYWPVYGHGQKYVLQDSVRAGCSWVTKYRHQSMASWWPRTDTSSVLLSYHFGVLVQVKLVGETLLDTLA